ncbi:MAG: extensin family protein [Sphingomonadaceae bacterium]|nr:extensin family protein [Sphingomonadaceae bacterium]
MTQRVTARPLIFVVALALVLNACVEGPRRPRAAPRPRVGRTYDPAQLRICIGDLDRMVARYALLPDRTFGGGCSALGSVQLRDIGTPTANLGAMTCPLARAFTLWVQNDLAGPAQRSFASRVVRIESFGTYSCRNVNGAATGALSEHAFANAVDVAAFVLENGRRVTIKDGWNGGDDEREFLRAVRAAACGRFQTVLSPDYNEAHHDHLHFDMGRGPFCR